MRLRDLACAFCLADRSALRFDRKGRPYFSCAACGARSFLPNLRDAVRHLANVEPLIRARAEQLATDDDAARRAVDNETAIGRALRAQISAPATAAADTSDATAAAKEAVR